MITDHIDFKKKLLFKSIFIYITDNILIKKFLQKWLYSIQELKVLSFKMTMVLPVNFIDHGQNYHGLNNRGSKDHGLLSKLSGPTWSYEMPTLV